MIVVAINENNFRNRLPLFYHLHYSVQICLYNFADFGERNGAIIKLTRNHLLMGLTSITLSSIKNSRRYFRTSLVDGLSGVPRLTKSTPVSNWEAIKNLNRFAF